MLANRSIQYRIYPDADQEELIQKTFGCVRFIWNQELSDEKEFYAATGKCFIPTPACYKKEYPFLKEVDSLALANAQLNFPQKLRRCGPQYHGRGDASIQRAKEENV